jgi:hypothetical protein
MKSLTSLLVLSMLPMMAPGADDAAEVAELPKRSAFNAEQIGRDPFARIDANSMAEQSTVVAAAENAGEDLAGFSASPRSSSTAAHRRHQPQGFRRGGVVQVKPPRQNCG